jgi:hypothetical protein
MADGRRVTVQSKTDGRRVTVQSKTDGRRVTVENETDGGCPIHPEQRSTWDAG